MSPLCKMLFHHQFEYANEVWNSHTIKCNKKTEQSHAMSDAFFGNTVEILKHHFSVTGYVYDYFIHVGSFNKQPCFTKFITTYLTCLPSYIQHSNHVSSRTDHPLKLCDKNCLQINVHKYL